MVFVYTEKAIFATRGGEVASRQAHNLEIAGSNPAPATRIILYPTTNHGWVAQLVERRTHKP